jgi:sugar phosphate isomerase/epimerase
VSDRVHFACSHDNFEACLALARSYSAGLELQGFAQPDTLDGDWGGMVRRYQAQLKGFENGLSMHGAFLDMVSASPDARVVQVARERYTHNLQIADMLGARHVVFHANFITSIRVPSYRQDWTRRQIDFWGLMVQQAERLGITVLLENMWEAEPSIIGDVLDAVQSPHLKACLDVGHAHLFSDVKFEDWVEALGDHLIYTHMNNNPGHIDDHRALDDGVIDYKAVLGLLRALPSPPIFTLEVGSIEEIRRSLPYFNLPEPARSP